MVHEQSYDALTETEVEFLKEDNDKIFFKSNYSFINAHKGLRPGNLHTFIATPGGGKSTLVRTIIIDLILSRKKVGIVLSEESKADLQAELSRTGIKHDYIEEYLKIFSEIDFGIKSAGEIFGHIHKISTSEKIDVLIYDNITTSNAYLSLSQKDQSEFALELKKICKLYHYPLIVFAHTGSHVTEDHRTLIDMNDIRESRAIVNYSQFFYVIQSFNVGEERNVTVRTVKYRGQPTERRLFKLVYHPKTRIFCNDEYIDFEKFKDMYKNRNKL